MKRNLLLALTLLLTCILGGCMKIEQIKKMRSFVFTYYATPEILLKSYTDDFSSDAIAIIASGKVQLYAFNTNTTEEYDRLCAKHNDMSYNKEIQFLQMMSQVGDRRYLAYDFNAINIRSNMDYDDNHPAGTSLTDIITFQTASPIQYITSGYKTTNQLNSSTSIYKYLKNSNSNDMEYLSPIIKNAASITPSDLVLLGADCSLIGLLIFDTPPTAAKTHTFTVSATTDEAKTFTSTIEYTFK